MRRNTTEVITRARINAEADDLTWPDHSCDYHKINMLSKDDMQKMDCK